MALSRRGGILGWIPIDRERVAELDESATPHYWHDPDANRACPLTCAQVVRNLARTRKKEDGMPHLMIRWQFTSTSAKALVGKPHDHTGAAKTLVEGFGGKLNSYYLA